MTNRSLPLRTHVETRPGSVIPTDVTERNELSLGESRYFVTFVDRASEKMKSFYMKTKVHAAELRKRHLRWVEYQFKILVKWTVLNERKDHPRGSKDLQVNGIEIPTTVRYTPQENGRGEQVIHSAKNPIRTFHVHSGAAESFLAGCLYTLCDARNRESPATYAKIPGKLLTNGKLSVAPFGISGCKVWVRPLNRIRKTLEYNAGPGTLLHYLSFRKYRVMLKYDHSVEVSPHSLAREDKFPIRK